jgi:hypothetical protein
MVVSLASLRSSIHANTSAPDDEDDDDDDPEPDPDDDELEAAVDILDDPTFSENEAGATLSAVDDVAAADADADDATGADPISVKFTATV